MVDVCILIGLEIGHIIVTASEYKRKVIYSMKMVLCHFINVSHNNMHLHVTPVSLFKKYIQYKLAEWMEGSNQYFVI